MDFSIGVFMCWCVWPRPHKMSQPLAHPRMPHAPPRIGTYCRCPAASAATAAAAAHRRRRQRCCAMIYARTFYAGFYALPYARVCFVSNNRHTQKYQFNPLFACTAPRHALPPRAPSPVYFCPPHGAHAVTNASRYFSITCCACTPSHCVQERQSMGVRRLVAYLKECL